MTKVVVNKGGSKDVYFSELLNGDWFSSDGDLLMKLSEHQYTRMGTKWLGSGTSDWLVTKISKVTINWEE